MLIQGRILIRVGFFLTDSDSAMGEVVDATSWRSISDYFSRAFISSTPPREPAIIQATKNTIETVSLAIVLSASNFACPPSSKVQHDSTLPYSYVPPAILCCSVIL